MNQVAIHRAHPLVESCAAANRHIDRLELDLAAMTKERDRLQVSYDFVAERLSSRYRDDFVADLARYQAANEPPDAVMVCDEYGCHPVTKHYHPWRSDSCKPAAAQEELRQWRDSAPRLDGLLDAARNVMPITVTPLQDASIITAGPLDASRVFLRSDQPAEEFCRHGNFPSDCHLCAKDQPAEECACDTTETGQHNFMCPNRYQHADEPDWIDALDEAAKRSGKRVVFMENQPATEEES